MERKLTSAWAALCYSFKVNTNSVVSYAGGGLNIAYSSTDGSSDVRRADRYLRPNHCCACCNWRCMLRMSG
jgi:hypothetical protein